jgi:ribose transport system substrate-binding protein
MLTSHRYLVALGVAASVAAFGQSASAQDIRIGFVLPELSNEAILNLDIGARARAEELGNVEILTAASYSGEDQAMAIENYIVAGVDILAYDTIDAAAAGPAVIKANEAGIPVICVLSCGATGEHLTFMSLDHVASARQVGRWMSKTLGADGVVAHVEGNPATVAGLELTAGFTLGLADNGIIKVAAQSPAMNFSREEGLAAATDMLTANPNLQGIYGIIDDVAMGALQAVRAAGRMDDVLVAGHNATCEALASLLKGELDFTVMIFTQALGAQMVDIALKIHAGEDVPDFVPMPTIGVDTAWANGILDGTGEDPPANIAPEIRTRLEAAKAGCN